MKLREKKSRGGNKGKNLRKKVLKNKVVQKTLDKIQGVPTDEDERILLDVSDVSMITNVSIVEDKSDTLNDSLLASFSGAKLELDDKEPKLLLEDSPEKTEPEKPKTQENGASNGHTEIIEEPEILEENSVKNGLEIGVDNDAQENGKENCLENGASNGHPVISEEQQILEENGVKNGLEIGVDEGSVSPSKESPQALKRKMDNLKSLDDVEEEREVCEKKMKHGEVDEVDKVNKVEETVVKGLMKSKSMTKILKVGNAMSNAIWGIPYAEVVPDEEEDEVTKTDIVEVKSEGKKAGSCIIS